MSLVTREMAQQEQNGMTNGVNGNTSQAMIPIDSDNTQITPRNGPFAEDDMFREYNPPPSSFSMPKQNGAVERSTTGLADFFSSEVFQIVLHNPATAHRLLKFSQARMCGENMEFLEKVAINPIVWIWTHLIFHLSGRPIQPSLR